MALWIEDDSNQNKGLRPGDNNNKETKTQQRQLHTESHNTKLSIKINMANTPGNVRVNPNQNPSDAFGEVVEALIAHLHPAGDEAPQQQVDEPGAQIGKDDEEAGTIEEGVGEATEIIEEEAGEDVEIIEDVIIPPSVDVETGEDVEITEDVIIPPRVEIRRMTQEDGADATTAAGTGTRRSSSAESPETENSK